MVVAGSALVVVVGLAFGRGRDEKEPEVGREKEAVLPEVVGLEFGRTGREKGEVLEVVVVVAGSALVVVVGLAFGRGREEEEPEVGRDGTLLEEGVGGLATITSASF